MKTKTAATKKSTAAGTRGKKTSRSTAPARKASSTRGKGKTASGRRQSGSARQPGPPASAVSTPAARAEALTRVFAALGARKPELWARAQVETGSDEIGRYVFLRALWMRVVEPGRLLAQISWDPAAATAFERMTRAGISLADLDAVVRFTQRMALEDVCRVIDDPIDRDEGIRWGMFRLDSDGRPLWELSDLGPGLAASEP